MKQYTKIEGTEKSYLKTEVYYAKGGLNYFSYKTDPRGYWVSVKVVEREEQERGIVIESFMMFGGGYREFLFEVKKQSQKSYEKAVAESGPVIEKLKAATLQQFLAEEKI
jgi:hypothetical protein